MNTHTRKPSTPNKILDAAQHLMLQEGYHGVSVDSIIERTGVSKGTFFYHFKSKEALASALLERFFTDKSQQIRDAAEQVNQEALPPLQRLLLIIDHMAPAYRCNNSTPGCLMAAFSYQLLNDMPQLKEKCQHIVSGWQQYFSPIFQNALKCSEQEANELARMMFCQLEGAFVVERVENSRELETQFQHLRRYVELLAQEKGLEPTSK